MKEAQLTGSFQTQESHKNQPVFFFTCTMEILSSTMNHNSSLSMAGVAATLGTAISLIGGATVASASSSSAAAAAEESEAPGDLVLDLGHCGRKRRRRCRILSRRDLRRLRLDRFVPNVLHLLPGRQGTF